MLTLRLAALDPERTFAASPHSIANLCVPQFTHKRWSMSAGQVTSQTEPVSHERSPDADGRGFTKISAYGAGFQARGKAVSAFNG